MVALSKNSTGKLNKIYKKLEGGANPPNKVNNKMSIDPYAASAAGVGMIAPLVAQQDEVAGGVLGGAASGASAGSVAGPWGMAAGAVIGGTIGGIQASNAKDARLKAEQEYRQALDKQSVANATQRGLQVPVNGNQTYSLTERKEGGKLSKLSNNTVLATGATHEEGGIKLPQLGAEVEDKETLKMTKDGGTYVMSDTLVNPTSGNTFAKDDLKLSKMKGRLEKMYDTRFSKNAINLLKDKEQKLVDLHEQVRKEQGLESADDTQIAKNGGMLKYPNGGEIDSLANKYYTQLSDMDMDGNGVKHKGYDYWLHDAPELLNNPNKLQVIRKMQELKKQNNLKVSNPRNSNNTTTTTSIVPNTNINNIKTEQQALNNRFGYNTVKEDGVFGAETNRARQDAAFFDSEKPQLLEEPVTKLYGSRKPLSVTSTEPIVDTNTTDKTSNKFDSSNLLKLTPYIDNITGALYNNQRRKEKLPNLSTLTYLNPKHVNYSQAIKDTRDTTTAFNRGVDTTNVNQGNANIMKAFALGKQQQAIAGISQEETNQNTLIDNDFVGRNKAIEEKNNMTIFNNAERNRLGRDEIRREGQQNIVDANMKLQTQLKSRNQESDDKDAELASDERSRTYIESKKAERKKSSIWGSRNGGKLSKLKISY